MEENNIETTPVVEQPKKKGNGFLIFLLVLIILGLAGYICYDKFYKKEPVKTKESQNQKDEPKASDKEDKPVIKDDSTINDKLIGSYSYKGEYVDIVDELDDDTLNDSTIWSSGKMAYEDLKLNADGSAIAAAGNKNSGGYSANGNWYVENDKVIVVDDECQELINEHGDANCNPRWEYSFKIDGEKVILTSNNNTATTVTLNKVNN